MNIPAIPPQALNQHIAILAKTGAGKTFCAKGMIVEPLLDAGKQVAVVDPTGAWWGLRLSRDGKRPGFDRVVILGGDHGDMPLTENMGDACARLVTEQGASIVFDTSRMTVGERTRWFTDFAITLYRTVRNPVHVVIDEVHNFCPQGKVPDPATGKMLHAGSQLFSGGRLRGLRMVGITQRPAKWHKDSLTSVDSLIVMRMLAPQDRKAVQEWIDGCGNASKGREVLNSLANLARGEGWFWFPDPEGGILERFRSPAIKTFDSGATPDGSGPRPEPKPIDLDELRSHLAEAVKEADENDPKKLRARIAELERGAQAPAPAVDVEAIYRKAFADAHVAILVSASPDMGNLDVAIRGANEAVADLTRARQRLSECLSTPMCGPSPPSEVLTKHLNGHAPGSVKKAIARIRRAEGLDAPPPEGLQPRHLRILAAIAWFEQVAGIEAPTRAQVAARAGVSSTSSSYANDLSDMKTAGVIGYPGSGNLCRTDAGKRIQVDLPSGDAWESLSSVVDPRHMRMLRAMRGGTKTREALAEAVGLSPTSSSFANDLSKLKTLALIVYPAKGEVKLADWLAKA